MSAERFTAHHREQGLLLAAILLWVGLQFVLAAPLPLLSESNTQLAQAARFGSPWQALDPSLPPLRPLQRLLFYFGAHASWVTPALLRVPSYLLHLASIALVWRIVRQLGASARAAAAAAALFAAFPAAKNLVWVAAIGGPGRTACLLAAFSCFLAWLGGAGLRAACGMIASYILALGFHQSAVLLPAWCLAWVVLQASGSPARRAAVGMQVAKRPAFLVLLAISVLHVVQVASIGDPHLGIKSGPSLAANFVKASVTLLPEPARWAAVEGARGNTGAPGYAVAASLLVVIWGAAGWLAWRGSQLARFVLIVALLDVGMPALIAGFTQRYAYFSAALIAVWLGVWSQHRPQRSRVLLVVGTVWLLDSWNQAMEMKDAGRTADTLLQQACETRAQVGSAPLVVVNPPDAFARERDIPVFNWGFRQAMAMRCEPGELLLVRTREYVTTSDVLPISPQELEAMRGNGNVVLLEYVEANRRFDVTIGGQPLPAPPR